ncbi:ThuA domain-containing protein [Mycoplasmatota bacterium]|nr:ThuA domain-containing protein [Mycoplasmatota bacterium]
MKKALLIWGGWEGHQPNVIAEKLGQELNEKGYNVNITSNFGVLLSEELINYDVIVPIWSCGIKGDIYLNQLLKAVEGGVGLATFHGGINWFEQEKYYEMIGAFYLYDTKPEKYNVTITDKLHPITKKIYDFEITSEKYFIQVDLQNNILASADFSGVKIPIAWSRKYGKGRVFYTTIAHSPNELFSEPCKSMILNGIDWCSRKI